MAYFAELDADQTVKRVVVAPSVEWVRDHLPCDGCTWVETTSDLDSDQYPGPGWTYDTDTFTPPPTEAP